MFELNTTMRRVIPLAFSVLMGAAAVYLVHQYIRKKEVALEKERQRVMANYQEPVEVIVAAKDLASGVTLEASQLTKGVVPEKFVQPYSVRTPKDLLGMVTIAPMAEGEQVLLNKVRRPEAVPHGSTLSSVTPKGKRAVTISVDALTGVGGFVRPSDAVDILWAIALPQPGEKEGQPVTVTLFQDIPVLAVGRDMAGTSTQKSEEAQQFTVTLALTPQETSFLLFAREHGRVQLSLRPRSEGGAVAVAPANINTLMEMQLGMKSSAPPALPPQAKGPPRQVEVYKGLKREMVVLPEEDVSGTP